MKPYWSNIIGYIKQVGNTDFDIITFYEPYWKKLKEMVDYSLHNGEIIGNNKEDGVYTDPISYEKLDINDPSIKILYSSKVTYYYKRDTLLELLKNTSLNPFTREIISWYDRQYIEQ